MIFALLLQFGVLGRGIAQGATVTASVISIGVYDDLASGTTDIGAR